MFNTKITLVTGSYPPDVCGVGDYTERLFNSSSKDNWTLDVFRDWRLSRLGKIYCKLKKSESKIIVIQYPTQGYGWSLGPQLIAIALQLFTQKKVCIVIHEFSKRKLKAKIATILFALANYRIFTTHIEKNYWQRTIRFSRNNFVIPIKSNVPKSQILHKWDNRSRQVVYFGLIAQGKGLHDFINTARLTPHIRYTIIGVIPKGQESLYQYLTFNRPSNVEIILDSSLKEVADILADSKIAFLPFPDGVSERRGSLLAALTNGCLVITSRGKDTPKSLDAVVYYSDKSSYKETVEYVLSLNQSDYLYKTAQIQEYLAKNIPETWHEISLRYEKILNTHDVKN